METFVVRPDDLKKKALKAFFSFEEFEQKIANR